VVGERVSLTTLHGVLAGLLHERVPVRDLVTILETLAAAGASGETHTDALVERVRGALARQLSHLHCDDQRTIWALTVHPETEQALFQSFHDSERARSVVMDPGFAERFVATLGQVAAAQNPDDPAASLAAMRVQSGPQAGRALFDAPTIAALLVFFMYALQCMSTVGVLRRETGSWRWPVIAFGYMFVLAWVLALVARTIVAAIL